MNWRMKFMNWIGLRKWTHVSQTGLGFVGNEQNSVHLYRCLKTDKTWIRHQRSLTEFDKERMATLIGLDGDGPRPRWEIAGEFSGEKTKIHEDILKRTRH